MHYSTKTTLLKAFSDIMTSANTGKRTILVLLDRPTDMVDQDILNNRLQDMVGMSGPVLTWFYSYLVGGSLCVSQPPKSATLANGVPQNSVLGPLLFLLYILPLGQIIQKFNDVSYHLFADVLQLYCLFKA